MAEAHRGGMKMARPAEVRRDLNSPDAEIRRRAVQRIVSELEVYGAITSGPVTARRLTINSKTGIL